MVTSTGYAMEAAGPEGIGAVVFSEGSRFADCASRGEQFAPHLGSQTAQLDPGGLAASSRDPSLHPIGMG